MAVRFCEWAAAKWGIVPPEVRWFSARAGMLGYMRDGEHRIWLRSSMPYDEIAKTVIHEVCHVARDARGLPNIESEVVADTNALLAQLR
jgi:hypothetical protein